MHNLRSSPDLALVVPFHNEEQFLPRLVESLRAQSAQNVPVVFIDNGSTDGSVELIQGCQEVRTGKWTCIEERTIGKVRAMKTATLFCTQQLGVGNVGFLDADSYLDDPAWVHNNIEIINDANGRLGYTYSPIDYFGFDALPVFKSAYRAYAHVLRFLVENVGWLANGQGFVCSSQVLKKYFREAELTTEIDLRCSLLALSQGWRAYLNPGLLVSSGRRMIVNAENFAAWCFYEREFYSKKDINAPQKLNLNAPAPLQDLPHDRVEQFFTRRAMKIACRHLIPLAIFDKSSYYLETIRTVLGLDVAAKLNPTTRRFPENPGYLLTDEFETMIRAIERDPATIAVASYLEELMRERYSETASLLRHAGRSNGAAQTRPERKIPLDDDARQNGWAMRDIAQTHLQLYKQLRCQRKSEKDFARVHRAYELATTLYSGYYQADGKPFITHSVGVASILAHLGLDAKFVAAGLLHNIYDNGDFGDGRRKVITKARRGLVRNAVGDDIEALIDRFRVFRILPATIDEIWSRLDQFNQTERNLIMMDLADHLEKYQDGGVFYFGDNHWVVDFVHQYGDRLTAIAIRLGHPKFAAMLREAFEQTPEEVPQALRTSRKYLGLVVPRSCRRRVYPVLRWRLNRCFLGRLLRQLSWLPGKQAAGMR
ncbi:MAG: glycosyltransferase [Candidatus Binatia bacterium]